MIAGATRLLNNSTKFISFRFSSEKDQVAHSSPESEEKSMISHSIHDRDKSSVELSLLIFELGLALNASQLLRPYFKLTGETRIIRHPDYLETRINCHPEFGKYVVNKELIPHPIHGGVRRTHQIPGVGSGGRTLSNSANENSTTIFWLLFASRLTHLVNNEHERYETFHLPVSTPSPLPIFRVDEAPEVSPVAVARLA